MDERIEWLSRDELECYALKQQHCAQEQQRRTEEQQHRAEEQQCRAEKLQRHLEAQQCDGEKKSQYINTLKSQIQVLQEELAALKDLLFGRKTEKLKREDHQFDEPNPPDDPDAIEQADESITVASYTRKKKGGKGRKPLPAHFPRVEIVYDLDEKEKWCPCGSCLAYIGEDRSEQLEIVPTQFKVLVHIRKKYACRQCEETIKRAQMPLQPIPKSIAAPGLLSHLIVAKYKDHLPLYRMENILQRMGG